MGPWQCAPLLARTRFPWEHPLERAALVRSQGYLLSLVIAAAVSCGSPNHNDFSSPDDDGASGEGGDVGPTGGSKSKGGSSNGGTSGRAMGGRGGSGRGGTATGG